MENANSFDNRKERAQDSSRLAGRIERRKEYKVVLWTGVAGKGMLDRIERIVPADSRQEAVGMVLMRMKVTDPKLIIQPRGISVYLV